LDRSNHQAESKGENTMRYFITIVSILVAGASVASTRTATFDETRKSVITGGVATLYALDPLTHTLSFEDGQPGSVFQNSQVKNRDSHIDFGNYNADSFTVGIQGSQKGKILDLGSAMDLQKEYGYQETVGKGQGFASLQVVNGKVAIFKDRKSGALQELLENAALFDETGKQDHSPVKLGHIYLIRLSDQNDKHKAVLGKIIVIEHRPNEQTTIRWERL
jgi:hypothetical protein